MVLRTVKMKEMMMRTRGMNPAILEIRRIVDNSLDQWLRKKRRWEEEEQAGDEF